MKIGEVYISGKVFLAPMAGVTDMAFRGICAEFGAALVCTEMVSAKGLLYNSENTHKLLEISENERPVSVQLFGSDPAAIGYAAGRVSELDLVDLIDINCGCPAPKIVKSGEGSALMKKPGLIGEIINAAHKNSGNKPITVKIRKGYNDTLINAPEIAKIAEESGASAICIHGRTREQMYSGKADWEIIAKVKDAISVPVIGNGDITSPEAAKLMLEQTGVDAVMIGRAAWGNPWIFSRTNHFLETGELLPEPSAAQKIELALRHTRLLIDLKGEYQAIREMRRHLSMYIKGLHGASAARILINKAETLTELECALISSELH